MKYTDELDKVSYSLGLSIASNLISSGVTTINAEAFIDGLNVVFSGKMPEIMPDEANNILQDYFDKLQQAKGKEAKAEGEKFLAENKKKEGVVALPSGLQYKILTAGNGPKPKASDTVKCHYEGRLINGTVFDSSIRTGRIPGKRSDRRLGRSPAIDACRIEMATLYSFRTGLWHTRRRSVDRTEPNPDFRCRTVGYYLKH